MDYIMIPQVLLILLARHAQFLCSKITLSLCRFNAHIYIFLFLDYFIHHVT